MTAEVVAMNKEAVALAADSAVTYGGSKIFTTAEKLFMLAPNHAVGVMIYNNAEFMDLPWNVLIKLYRNKLVEGNQKFATLEEYVEDFIVFLTTRGESIFPSEQQDLSFAKTIDMVLNEIVLHFWEVISSLYDNGDEIDDTKIAETISESIAYIHGYWQRSANRYSDADDASFKECLLDKYGQTLVQRRDALLENLPLTDDDKQKLEEVCLFLFTKEKMLPNYTGVAFAGYGETDLFPRCVVLLVENLVCGRLKYRRRQHVRIDFNDPVASITPLAQDDVAFTILGGDHPMFLKYLTGHLSDHFTTEEITKLLEAVRKDVSVEYTNPILQTVAGLPKGELATIAETLVSTTSFMRKHSMDIETVGGATDVAVITKKDGFVWIKRKHYFDIDYNQHFLNR